MGRQLSLGLISTNHAASGCLSGGCFHNVLNWSKRSPSFSRKRRHIHRLTGTMTLFRNTSLRWPVYLNSRPKPARHSRSILVASCWRWITRAQDINGAWSTMSPGSGLTWSSRRGRILISCRIKVRHSKEECGTEFAGNNSSQPSVAPRGSVAQAPTTGVLRCGIFARTVTLSPCHLVTLSHRRHSAEPPDDVEENRRQKNAEHRHPEHTAEHGQTKGPAHLGASPGGDRQRHHS